MPGWPSTRALATLIGATLLGLTAVACGPQTADWSDDGVARGDAGMRVHVINSQVAVGPTRLAFGIFSKDGALVHNATGTVQLVRLDASNQPTAFGARDLRAVHIDEQTHSGHDHDPLATMYIAHADIDQKDWWGAEFDIKVDGKRYRNLRARFFVAEKSTVPGIGQPAPRTTQPTTRTVQNIAEIDSSLPPHPELHDLTVAEAIDTRKPSVIAFATPAFCQTRFCGPVIEEVVWPLAKDYRGRANFVHVEPYRLADARQGKLVPIAEMTQWGLATEPYIFVLDGSGRVAAQFEGIVEKDEVASVLDRLLKG